MSKKAKIVKDKKKFPWGKIWYYIKSLFSNSIAMECGMKRKWYVSLIIFVFSLMISVIPQVVQTSQTSGSSVFSQSTNDQFALGLTGFVNDNGKDITFGTDGRASMEGYTYDSKPIYSLSINYEPTNQKNLLIFEIFYLNMENDDANLSTTVNQIRMGNHDSEGKIIEGTDSVRSSSYIIITPTYFEARVYKIGQTTGASAITGDFYKLRSSLQGKTLKEILTTPKDGYEANSTSLYLQNFYDLTNDVYLNNKIKYIWINFGIICGLNAGITILMGFLFWVMTRGKSNPLKNEIKWYSGFGIASWLMMTPALLSLIFGFLFTNFAMIIYILCFGIRCMWLSMKNLRPNYQQ